MASSGPPPPKSRDDFEIAIVCALAVEYDAVSLLIDQFWDENGDKYGRANRDRNTYTTGRMGSFDVVLLLLPNAGKVSAASAASSFRSSFTNITLALLVGTCGGVPYTKDREEILLGDVVISKTVVQYDLGSQYAEQFLIKETLEEQLGRPDPNIRGIVHIMETDHEQERLKNRAAVLLEQLQSHARRKKLRKRTEYKYEYPGTSKDRLFKADYLHKHQILLPYRCCEEVPCESSHTSSCVDLGCEDGHLVLRQRLHDQAQSLSIFVGRFGSGDTMLKSGTYRDQVAQRHGLLAFEMEGAGVWDELPCIIIKGISNYADGHWNADSDWQHFAAATAAATARALIERYPKTDRSHAPLVIEERRERTKEEAECLRDMHVTDPAHDKKRIEDTNGGLLKDSYIWILSNDDYIQWRENSDSGLLWIKGDPGKGKTMLLCGLLNEFQADGVTKPYYFFCQASDSRLNSATKVLCSLVHSIACEDELALAYVMKEYQYAGRKLFNNTNSWTAISQILLKILQNIDLKDKVFVIDGLDECVVDLPLLLDFIAQAPGLSEAKWVVSSRNWPDIEERLNTSAKELPLSLELNEQSVSDAVHVYITHKLDQLVALKKLDENSRCAVETYLSAHANGTFLWVALVYKELFKEGVKKRHLQDLMTAFPPELEPLYNRMMEQVCSSRDKGICVQVLELISLVYRPISLVELASLVEIFEDTDDFDEMRDIIATCGSFLLLRDDVIYFIHQSAKDFLLNNTPRGIFIGGIAFKHHEIFSRSVQILSKNLRRDMYNLRHPGALPSAPNPDPIAPLRYACLYWVDHLQASDIKCSGKSAAQASLQNEGIIHSFLNACLLHWLEAFCLMGKLSEGIMAIKMLESLKRQDGGELHKFVRDARRFVLSFRSAIEYTPLQLYSSALLFAPISSIVRRTFESVHTAPLITQKPSVQFEWNACVQRLEGHQNWVYFLAYSPDNTKLASRSFGGNVRLWDRATGACLQSLALDDVKGFRGMAFSPDNSQLAIAFNDYIKILDLNTGACIMVLKIDSDIWFHSVLYSHSGMQLMLHNDLWSACDFRIIDLKTGMMSRGEDYYNDVGESVVCRLEETDKEWFREIRNPIIGSRYRILSEEEMAVVKVVFTLDGTKFALQTYLTPQPVYIFDATTGECLRKFTPDFDYNKDFAFSPAGTQLATAGSDNKIRIWDVKTGDSLFTFSSHEEIKSIVFSADGTELASAGYQTIRIWDLTLDASVEPETKASIRSVTYSPDNTHLAFITKDDAERKYFTIEIWDAVSGVCQQQIQVGRVDPEREYWLDAIIDFILCLGTPLLAFSPDNTQLAYSYEEKDSIQMGEIAIQNLVTNTQLNMSTVKALHYKESTQHQSIIFSPSGTRLVLANALVWGEGYKNRTERIEIGDATNGTVVHTLYPAERIVEIKISSDSTRLGSLSIKDIAVIWDMDTGACLQTLDFNWERIFGRPLMNSWAMNPLQLGGLQRAQAHCSIANILQNQDSLHSSVHEFDLGSNNSWILRRGEPFLWLPPEYRPSDMTFAGSNVAIVAPHRELCLFGFNLAELDAEMASNTSSIIEV